MSEIAALRTVLQRTPQDEPAVAFDHAIGVYRHAAGMINLLEQIQAEAKAMVTGLMVETGQTEVKAGGGRAYVSKPGLTVRYDVNGLERLVASRPDLAPLLSAFRTEKERPGVLIIR